MKSKTLEGIGWILLFGFLGCVVCASFIPMEPQQYIATLIAVIVFGIVGATCLIVSQRRRNQEVDSTRHLGI